MTAYIVFERDSTEDQQALDRYAAHADGTFAGHDVKALVDYGPHEVLEGPAIEGVVVLQFPDRESAKAWYFSDAYQRVAQDRLRGATYRAVIVDGVAEGA